MPDRRILIEGDKETGARNGDEFSCMQVIIPPDQWNAHPLSQENCPEESVLIDTEINLQYISSRFIVGNVLALSVNSELIYPLRVKEIDTGRVVLDSTDKDIEYIISVTPDTVLLQRMVQGEMQDSYVSVEDELCSHPIADKVFAFHYSEETQYVAQQLQ